MAITCDIEKLSQCPVCGADIIASIDPSCNLARCLQCQVVFDNPRPTQAAIALYYSQPGKYKAYTAAQAGKLRLFQKRSRRIFEYARQGPLLDVGAGTGQFLSICQERFAPVAGTEVSAEGVRLAKINYGLELLQGDLLQLTLPKDHFNVITLFHVLEHVPSPLALLRRCQELLRVGGYIFIAVPNDILSLRATRRRMLRRLGWSNFRSLGTRGLPRITLDGSISEIHVTHFTVETLERAVSLQGFHVLENSWDPYLSSTGLLRFVYGFEFFIYRLIRACNQRWNLYPALWIVAQKQDQ